jgi:hypothetical protein
MAISKLEAIQSLHPTAQFVLKGGELTWQSEDITEPTDAEITAEQTRLQAEYDNNQYARDRAIAYPALAEQFDKLWHDINNGTLDNTGAFYTALKTVKDDNPKPGV